MSSTLPQPDGKTADLEAEVATLRRELDEVLDYFRRLRISPKAAQKAPRSAFTAAQIRARRQRIAASGLSVVRDGG